jgi:IS1 family transposase
MRLASKSKTFLRTQASTAGDSHYLLASLGAQAYNLGIMNRLSLEHRAKIVGMIAEGNSLRSTSRMADVSISTVTKLLVDVGAACSAYQDRAFRNLKLRRIQCDEIWSFVYAKQKNVTPSMLERGHAGDVWTWTALDAETKLVPSWRVGSRDAHTAAEFIEDLAGRLATRVQLTTNGYKPYLSAVEGALGADVDYAMLVNLYGQGRGG